MTNLHPYRETTGDTAPDAAPEAPPRGRPGKRELILAAAIRVFARTGYHGARVSDIASEAGIAYGLVYHYFRNKEEILTSIFEQRWGAFLAAVEEVGKGRGTTREKLVSIAALVLGAYQVRPDWVKVLVLEIQRSEHFTEPGQLRAVSRLFQSVARILRDGQDRGELRRDVDADIASTMFLGALEIAVTSLVLGVTRIGEDESEEAYCSRVGETVVDVFTNGASHCR
ncbi:MAG: TetR/AcrR family transcriptional regulator [Myxococcota bacterium]